MIDSVTESPSDRLCRCPNLMPTDTGTLWVKHPEGENDYLLP